MYIYKMHKKVYVRLFILPIAKYMYIYYNSIMKTKKHRPRASLGN